MTQEPETLDFDSWYRAEYTRVDASVRTALSMSTSEVGESVDEAFARAFEKWASVRTMASPTSWTVRVAINVYRRSWWRRTRLRDFAHGEARVAVVELGDSSIDTWRALGALTRRQREALVLHHLAGYSQAEVADFHGVAPGTSAATLHQARSKMRSLLSEPTEKENQNVD